jgi:hypothetical protein
MNHKEQGLVEDIWYSVMLKDDYYDVRYYYPPVKVEGKFHFVGKLIVHIGNQLVFTLEDNKGSVILPFNFIHWMVPLYKKKEKKEGESPDDLQP